MAVGAAGPGVEDGAEAGAESGADDGVAVDVAAGAAALDVGTDAADPAPVPAPKPQPETSSAMAPSSSAGTPGRRRWPGRVGALTSPRMPRPHAGSPRRGSP